MWFRQFATMLRNSVTAGLLSASFWWIAKARRNDSIASTVLPVADCRTPMLMWLFARSRRNAATAGLSSASFCRIVSARFDSIASAGWPVEAARPIR